MDFIKSFVVILLVFGIKSLDAQEMLGIVNSRYAGITGSVINPAVTVTSPFYIDINLAAADFFAENNYVYLAKEEYRFSRFFSKNPDYPTHGMDNTMIAYDYYNTKDKKAFTSERLIGPSVAVTVGRHSFGIVTGARAFMSTKHVPYEIAKFAFERLNLPNEAADLYNTRLTHNQDIYNAEMAWAEVGFNYSYVFKQESSDYWAAGVTVKDLLGYAGSYLNIQNMDYIVISRDSLLVNNLNAEAGYSLPVNFETNQYMKDPLFRGKGIGFDLGVIYQKLKTEVQPEKVSKLCAQNYTPYKYKIGVSLLDIGRIRFTENAEKLVFDNAKTSWPYITYNNFTSVRDLTNLLGEQFYGDTTTLVQGKEISIALPTALSVQTDVNFYKNWYLNGTMVLPLQISKSGLRRPALLAVTPRYETALFDLSMPISLFDWTEPRLGLSARFLWFFVGTEKISGFFHYKDFTGLDFYFGAKISLRKGFCHTKSGKTRNSNKIDKNCGIEEYKMFKKKSE
jgi:hypothetical protein